MNRKKRIETLLEEATSDVALRLLLIHYVYNCKITPKNAAEMLFKSRSWAYKWLKRYKKQGYKGLETRNRSGRPPKIPRTVMRYIMRIVDRKDFWTATELCDLIYLKSGVRYTVDYCADLFRKWGYTMKVPVSRHVNAATDEEVAEFQEQIQKDKTRLESLGYTILMQDEAIFMAEALARRRMFSKIGVRSTCVMSGTRQKRIVYGAIAMNGKQIFRQYEKFDAVTFVKFLKEAVRKFGKIVMIADRASQHRAKVVTKFLNKNKHRVKLIFLPRGSPYLNPAEECWRQSKHDILVKPFVSLQNMIKDITKYYKIKRFNLDIMSYLLRAPP